VAKPGFGGLTNFRAACDAAADVIRRHLVPSAAPLLVVAFDVPFYGLAAQLYRTSAGTWSLLPVPLLPCMLLKIWRGSPGNAKACMQPQKQVATLPRSPATCAIT